jgi:beta-xylosidase
LTPLVSGHAICRPGQLSLEYAVTKVNNADRREIFTAGIYAPTLRHHNGRFYIVCTNLVGPKDPELQGDSQPSNFLITATDLGDPATFSDPLYFDFYGIDPSLFFDDDGSVYLQGSFIHGYDKKPATVIRQAKFDAITGSLMSEAVNIWQGAGDKCPEGPHMYKRDGMYWLLIAEGGTHATHKVTMARSSNIWGPFESYEQNPVLTSTNGSDIRCVGHAELFDDVDGNWWACVLARREFGCSYPLGRETYLTPVTWRPQEFPYFEPVEFRQKTSRNIGLLKPRSSCTVNMSSPETIYLRSPVLAHYKQVGAGTHLRCTPIPLGAYMDSPTFIGQRQTALASIVHAVVDLTALPISSHCGLSLYKDTFRHVSLDLNSEKASLSLAACYVGQPFAYLNETSLQGATAVKLIIESTIHKYEFSYAAYRDGTWAEVASLGHISAADMSGDDFTGMNAPCCGVG